MNDDMFSPPRNYPTKKSDAAAVATDGMAAHVFGTAGMLVGASVMISAFAIAFPPLIALLGLSTVWHPDHRD
jgi:hypothetical protein